MFRVAMEKSSPVFGNFNWFRIAEDDKLCFQAYLNKEEADKICEKKNQEKRITDEEIALIKSKAEEKRLKKILDKVNS